MEKATAPTEKRRNAIAVSVLPASVVSSAEETWRLGQRSVAGDCWKLLEQTWRHTSSGARALNGLH